jgi:hypothetical protein
MHATSSPRLQDFAGFAAAVRICLPQPATPDEPAVVTPGDLKNWVFPLTRQFGIEESRVPVVISTTVAAYGAELHQDAARDLAAASALFNLGNAEDAAQQVTHEINALTGAGWSFIGPNGATSFGAAQVLDVLGRTYTNGEPMRITIDAPADAAPDGKDATWHVTAFAELADLVHQGFQALERRRSATEASGSDLELGLPRAGSR